MATNMTDNRRSSLAARVRRLALGVTVLAVAACSGDSASAPAQDDAARAVDLFAHLADSIARTGGDSHVGSAYASLAEAIRQGGRISPIVITVDGVATTFLATAQQAEITFACLGSQPCAMIKSVSTLRTLIAWQQADPRRVVQLSSESDGDPIRAYLVPSLVPFPGASASLVFFDGKGGAWFGTSGSQKFAVATSSTACTSAGGRKPVIAIFPAPPRCTQADFTIAFNGKAEPSTFLTSRNTATGTHTFAMAGQPVLGARFELTAATPPLPPILVLPSASLPATLSARVDSVVTLTLTVSNPSSMPATVARSSGQQYDFTVTDAASGALLWRWAMGVMFTQALVAEMIPANGSLSYTASWKPTQKGNLLATGSLVSVSHRAEAKLAIMVP